MNSGRRDVIGESPPLLFVLLILLKSIQLRQHRRDSPQNEGSGWDLNRNAESHEGVGRLHEAPD